MSFCPSRLRQPHNILTMPHHAMDGNVPMPTRPLARIVRALHKLPDMHDVVAPAPLHLLHPPQDAQLTC